MVAGWIDTDLTTSTGRDFLVARFTGDATLQGGAAIATDAALTFLLSEDALLNKRRR